MPDYRFNIPRPTERLLSGIQQGLGIGQIIEQRKQAEAAQVQQQQTKDALTTLNAIENPTADDYTKVASLLPKGQADSLRANWEVLSKEKQSNQLKFAGQTMAAFNANPEIAISMLEKRAEAERNAGNEDEAKGYETWVAIAKENPDAVKRTMGIMVSALPGGKDVINSVSKISADKLKAELQPGLIKKQAADLGLTEAQTAKALAATEKLDFESKKVVMELESLKKEEIPVEKKFDLELKLNDRFVKRSANFIEGERNYEVIKSSAADNSGAGDVALVTSFMKMLDPGSVVRETEFANARDTAGLLAQLKNQAQKIQTGQFLGVEQRAAFSRLAKQYLDAAQKQQKRVKKDLGVIVKNYSLNEENVFGEKREAVKAPLQIGKFTVEVVE